MVKFSCFWRLVAGKIIALFPVDMNNQKIHNLVDPATDQEAATKKYVDDTAAGGEGDMLKAIYDPNDDGVVKDSDKLEASTKVQVQDHIPKAHTLASHSTKAHSELTGVSADQHHAQAHTLDSHSEKKLDQLDEKTPAAGVTVDGCLVKDGKAADSNKLEGSTKDQVRVHEPISHTHVEANITDLDHDAQKIKSKAVDAPLAADDGKALTYDHANSKYKHAAAGGFPAPDIDSTWQSIPHNETFTFNHNLGTDNILVQVWANQVANWTNAHLFQASCMATGFPGLIRRISNNQLMIINKVGQNLYFKLRMWKWT